MTKIAGEVGQRCAFRDISSFYAPPPASFQGRCQAPDTLTLRNRQQPSSHEIQIGQRAADEQPVRILRQPMAANLYMPEDPLDYPEHMLALRVYSRLRPVRLVLGLRQPLVPPALCGACSPAHPRHAAHSAQSPPAGRCRPHRPTPVLPVQQVLQRLPVMHVHRRRHHRMRQPRAAVHPRCHRPLSTSTPSPGPAGGRSSSATAVAQSPPHPQSSRG